MEVFVANEQGTNVDEARLSSLARHALESEDVHEGELSILLVDANHIRNLNMRFAGEAHATDVLAFPMNEDEDDPSILGDVVICPEIASENAARLPHGLQAELEVLLVHGTLHLLGYDHQDRSERAQMEARVKEIIDSFSFSAV